MFVPIPSSSTKIVNKTIVYSDTVLPLGDMGENLKITTVNNVDVYELNSCLTTLFDSNKEVTFNTVQYSRKDKKLYIYADKTVSTKELEDEELVTYKPLTKTEKIKNEIDSLLNFPINLDPECVSLSDLVAVYTKYSNDYHDKMKEYRCTLYNLVKSNISDYSCIILYDFDYSKKQLYVGFKRFRNSDSEYKKIYFTKKNDILYLVKSYSSYDMNVFQACSETLSRIYDFCLKNEEFNAKNYYLTAVNSSLPIYLSSQIISIGSDSMGITMNRGYYHSKWDISCNNGEVLCALKNNIENLTKSMFVKISDCPQFTQSVLREFREKQLKSLVKKEERAKRRAKLEKIFPFTKRRK